MVDFLIGVVRFPIAVVTCLLGVIVYALLVVPVTTAVLPFAFVYFALFHGKGDLEQSWVMRWPFINDFETWWSKVWAWVFSPSQGANESPVSFIDNEHTWGCVMWIVIGVVVLLIWRGCSG